jgi:hypothetical protein
MQGFSFAQYDIAKMQAFCFYLYKVKGCSFDLYKIGYIKKCKEKCAGYKMQGYSFIWCNIGEKNRCNGIRYGGR